MGLASGSAILSEWYIQLWIAAASDGSPRDYTDVSIAPRGWHLGGWLGVEQSEWPSLPLAPMSVGINELPKFKFGSDLPW